MSAYDMTGFLHPANPLCTAYPHLEYCIPKGGVTLPNGKLEFNLNLFFKHHFHNNINNRK